MDIRAQVSIPRETCETSLEHIAAILSLRFTTLALYNAVPGLTFPFSLGSAPDAQELLINALALYDSSIKCGNESMIPENVTILTSDFIEKGRQMESKSDSISRRTLQKAYVQFKP